MENPARWRQRLSTFQKGLVRLEEAIKLLQSSALSDLERDGVIQRFEYTQELAWKTLKCYIEHQEGFSIMGSRDTIRQAFKMGIIHNTSPWFDMLESRNITSHVYDEEKENETIDRIAMTYYPILKDMCNTLLALSEKDK